MQQLEQSHQEIITTIIRHHFNETPQAIERIAIGISNEVYDVTLKNKSVIARLSSTDKYLRGSHVHIPEFKALNIKVPDLLAEDYTQSHIPLCYQIQSKIEGQDLGIVIQTLTQTQLIALAKEVADIFRKVKTLPVTNQFGLILGGDNDLSNSWSERMKIWIEESIVRGSETGVMDEEISQIAHRLYDKYQSYFNTVKPTMYYGDICSKNVMIYHGKFNGLVDLDGLTQGDPLEVLGRIKLSWHKTPYGELYVNTIMQELNLNKQQKQTVIMYALLNQISWACENGIQFNQNTKPIINWEKAAADKQIILSLADELQLM